MKVLHVIPSVGPLRGGPSFVIRTLTRGLAQAGLQVDVASTDDNGPEKLDTVHGSPVMVDGVTHWYFPRQTRFYQFSRPLQCWLSDNARRYDLLHIHALFSHAPVTAAFTALRSNVPYIVRPLGTLNRWGVQNRRPWLKKLSLSLIERRILASAAALHYTSEQERLEAVELGIAGNSVIIPNAVENSSGEDVSGEFRAKHPELLNRRAILFLSRIDPKKGIDLLLPAFVSVLTHCPDVVLVLAGDGDPAYVARLKQRAIELGVSTNVIWTGFLQGRQRRAAMTDADLFVLPSHSENFGVAVAEAMSFGLPVVISDQVGIHREISHAKAGLVVQCDVQLLADALVQLLRDANLRSQIGQSGRVLVKTRFSPGAVTQALLHLYKDITATRLSRPA